jgi:hypothetical protein
LHDTYFVVAHFHYVLSMGVVFGLFAAFYHWCYFLFGRPYSEHIAKLNFWFTFFGANITFFPMHFLGLAGMPRRIADYPDVYSFWNYIASVGAVLSLIGIFFFLIVVYELLYSMFVCSFMFTVRSINNLGDVIQGLMLIRLNFEFTRSPKLINHFLWYMRNVLYSSDINLIMIEYIYLCRYALVSEVFFRFLHLSRFGIKVLDKMDYVDGYRLWLK